MYGGLCVLSISVLCCMAQENFQMTQDYYLRRTVYHLPWNRQAGVPVPSDPFASNEPAMALAAYDDSDLVPVYYKRCSDPPISQTDFIGMQMCSEKNFTKGCMSTGVKPLFACVCDGDLACPLCNITKTPCSPLDQFCDPDHSTACNARHDWSCDPPTCTCRSGWTTNHTAVNLKKQKQCGADIDECSVSNPCQNGATCVNTPGSYTCKCTDNYAGAHCEDLKGCERGLLQCGAGAICQLAFHDQYQYGRCVCKHGSEGNPYISCFPDSSTRTARAVGGNLYTFDDVDMKFGRKYQGTCPVTFVRRCRKSPFFDDFKVVLHSTQDVVLWLHGHAFQITAKASVLDQMVIAIDGQVVNLPHDIDDVHVEGTKPEANKKIYRVTTDFGLMAEITTIPDMADVQIHLPDSPAFRGKLCGLGGNMDGNPFDDQRFPNGSAVDDVDSWGDSWVAENLADVHYYEFSDCCVLGSVVKNDPAMIKKEEWAACMTPCRQLTDPYGVFGRTPSRPSCFDQVNTQITLKMYNECIYDVGTMKDKFSDADIIAEACKHLTKFAQVCATAIYDATNGSTRGIHWRSESLCPPPPCPQNSWYNDDAMKCNNTCADPHATDHCRSTEVVERCVCNNGYVFNGRECVLPRDCPGFHHGYTIHHKENQTGNPCTWNCMFLNGDVNEVNKGTFCKEVVCQDHSSCKAVDGIRDCFCDEGYLGDGRHGCRVPQRHCADLQRYHGITTTGISPLGIWSYINITRTVFCDMDTDGGGWTVIQRRVDTTDFNRTWAEYALGFGTSLADGNSFWYGLEMLHTMTSYDNETTTLRIEIEQCGGTKLYQEYEGFKVASNQTHYTMTYSETRGSAGDAFASDMPSLFDPNGMQFSTWDNDNDILESGNCAKLYGSGWWDRSCTASNVNGKFYEDCGGAGAMGVASWQPKAEEVARCPKRIEMKIRQH